MSHKHHHIGNAKIYKLIVGEFFYYGSTHQSPCERLYTHKVQAKKYPERKIYKHINGNWDAVKIEVVERLKCETREEVWVRENEYINKYLTDEKCLNERVAHQTQEELTNKRSEAQRIRRQNQSAEDKERRRIRHNELQQKRRAELS